MKKFKSYINSLLAIFNLKLIKVDFFVDLDKKYKNSEHEIKRYKFIFNNKNINDTDKVWSLVGDSKSQLFQDLFVINELNYLKKGYFIEIGAANGIDLSNTYMLEKKFNWEGIVVEPAKAWVDQLIKNRKCKISNDCLYSESGKIVEFFETTKPEFSTINISGKQKDIHEDYRNKNNQKYELKTISFTDFSKKYNIPNNIDYVSIDTEGTEYEILKSIDLNKFKIKVFTIEHNFSANREKIAKYLNKHGYARVMEEHSYIDDWYVLK